MQVNIEDKNSVKKILHFEIPNEDIKKELNKAYGELRKTASIKGFRKGKTPRKILEAKFSKDVHADIAPRLIQDAFSEVLKEQSFQIVGSPKIDPPELNPKTAYAFDIEIDVKPEIDDIDFKGLSLKKNMYTVSEDQIDSQIHMVQKTLAKKETVQEERPVKEDDFVLIDYEGYVDGQPFDQTPKIENYVMAIGGNTLPQAFSEKLIGVIPQKELEVEVSYSADDPDKTLAGRTIVYKVFLKEIQEDVLPPADDALAQELGKYETLDQVKKEINDTLTTGNKKRVHHELSEQVFTTLLERHPFEAPEAMIEVELENIVTEAEQSCSQNNTSLEKAGLSRDILKSQYRDVAEKQAKRHLLMGKIIDQENLELTDEELERSFEEMAENMRAKVDAIKNFFNKDQNQLEYFKLIQLEKKAVGIIIDNAEIEEVDPDQDDTTSRETAKSGTETETQEDREDV
ncbi:MAG: trigger factor [Thermodesulfobacteriota bacterium]|nr:trigger factor [Thermodesulfobacteriota bacterium]